MWKGMKPGEIILAHSSSQKKACTGEVRFVWGEMRLEVGQVPDAKDFACHAQDFGPEL